MLRSADMQPDRYRHDRYLRQWTLFGGYPRCLLDALDTATATEEEIVTVEERNRVLAELLAAVEVLEAAQTQLARIAAQDAPPPETVSAFEADGTAVVNPNPEWAAWQTALANERDADDLTRAYALVRLGRPQEPAEGEEFSPEWEAYQQALAIIEATG